MQLFSTPIIPASSDAFWELPESNVELENRRMLVISRPFDQGSPAATTLAKMMSACRLGSDDYAILQLGPAEVLSWSLLRGAATAGHVLLLGVMPAELGIQAMFALNRPNSFGGVTFIPSLPLEQLVVDGNSRRELWENGLKPAFGL